MLWVYDILLTDIFCTGVTVWGTADIPEFIVDNYDLSGTKRVACTKNVDKKASCRVLTSYAVNQVNSNAVLGYSCSVTLFGLQSLVL